MQQLDKIKQYTTSMCEQIRWKKAHNIISKEVENHLIDQKDNFIKAGLSEESAIHKAIVEMGDPITIGTMLDTTHKPKTEWSIIILTFLILILGIGIRFFIPNSTQNIYSSNLFFTPFIESLIYTSIGIVCMFVAYYVDFTIFAKYPKTIFIILILFSITIISFSKIQNGRSVYAPYLWLVFTVSYASLIYSFRNESYKGIIFCGILAIIPITISILCLSIGSAFSFSVCCIVLLTFSILHGYFNVNKLYGILLVYLPSTLSLITFFISILIKRGYQFQRIIGFFSPIKDISGIDYVRYTIKNIISNAKLYGTGGFSLNSNLPSYKVYLEEYLPESKTTYLLTYLIGKFGFISLILILTILIFFIFRCYVLCKKQKSVLGKLISISVLVTFTIQITNFIISNLGVQTFSTLPLPLFCYSPYSIIINMTLIGIMLSTFRSSYLIRDTVYKKQKSNKLISIVDGKIIIDTNAIYT